VFNRKLANGSVTPLATVPRVNGAAISRPADGGEIKGPYVLDAINSEGVVVIGRGTRIVGEITDCAKLEIQGTVEGSIIADALVVREGGVVKGDLQAAHAEIHGQFKGRLDVRDLLDVRSTGRVEGELSYGKLAVAMGGHISGQISSEVEDALHADAVDLAHATPRTLDSVALNGANGYNGSGTH
jgi:cytoskeletal protein CcmA (bactofilin family)